MAKKEEKTPTPSIPEPSEPDTGEESQQEQLPDIPADKETTQSKATEEKVEENAAVADSDTQEKESATGRLPEPEDSEVDLKLVQYLMQIFEDSELGEIEVSQGDFLLRLSKNCPAPVAMAAPMQAAPAASESSNPAGGSSSPSTEDDKDHFFIKSPMVGTFYRSPTPDSDVFVDIGQKVQEKTTVCIIEAMKVMNELPADCTGTIVDVLVENGNGVEYGQPLFKVARK